MIRSVISLLLSAFVMATTIMTSTITTTSAFTPLSCLPSSTRAGTSFTSSLRYISTSFDEQQHHPHNNNQHYPYHQGYHHPYATTHPTNTGGGGGMDVLDMNISEERILKHYQEWCTKFQRRQDNFRFIVFQRNYLSQFKWNLAAGKQAFTLNEYADCTEEEYRQLMEKAAQNVVYNDPITDHHNQLPPAVEDTFEVSVITDDETEHDITNNTPMTSTTTTSSSSSSSTTPSSTMHHDDHDDYYDNQHHHHHHHYHHMQYDEDVDEDIDDSDYVDVEIVSHSPFLSHF